MKIILVLIILLPLKMLGQKVDSVIFWTDSYDLTWDDFQGNSDSLSFAIESNRLANAASSVGLEFVGVDSMVGCYLLKSVFYRNTSWTTDTTDLLLSHEQVHFHLIELSARRFRKRYLEEYRNCMNEDDLNDLFDLSFKEFTDNSSLYDAQTNYGTVVINQKLWNEKVKTKLDSLKDYTENVVICYCD
ncbi:MAG: hypothetical protein RLP12_17000 [Ekhidna sp.]